MAFFEPDADALLRSSAAREADGAGVETTPACCDAYAVEFASFDVGTNTTRLESSAASDPDGACAAE